uniref:Sushi domain-containing protein n=1 Tax=Oryzias latipes TaxID=8090 RepID=A0A3P9H315_ORYLA
MYSVLLRLTFMPLLSRANLHLSSCSSTSCSRLPGVLNAYVSEQTRKDVYQLGETILFTCDTGFISDLPIKYVCSSEGWVTLRQESCYSSTASCEHPSAQGGLRINGLPENNSPIPPGHVLIFGCDDPDKRLNGSSVLICDRDGQWNKPVPSCEDASCKAPRLKSSTIQDGTYGNVIRFSCKSRSEILKGPTEIYCDESGKWSGEVPECKEVTCDTPQIAHGRVTDCPKVYKEDNYLTFVCDKNYKPADEKRSNIFYYNKTQFIYISPCTVTQEEMDRNNLQLLKDWLDKVYLEHNDHITFRCKSGKRHDGRVAMRQQCIEGVIQLPTCV